MHIRHWTTSLAALCVATTLLAGCGGSSAMTSRGLTAITVLPATADGSAFSGKVQFTATGYWTAAPLTTKPFSATWVACQNNATTQDVTVSADGLATCASGAKGVYDVNAWSFPINDGPVCNAITACGGGCTIVGSAQLTCP